MSITLTVFGSDNVYPLTFGISGHEFLVNIFNAHIPKELFNIHTVKKAFQHSIVGI